MIFVKKIRTLLKQVEFNRPLTPAEKHIDINKNGSPEIDVQGLINSGQYNKQIEALHRLAKKNK